MEHFEKYAISHDIIINVTKNWKIILAICTKTEVFFKGGSHNGLLYARPHIWK